MDGIRFLILTVCFVCLVNQALAAIGPQPKQVKDLVALKPKLKWALSKVNRKFVNVKIIVAAETDENGTFYEVEIYNNDPHGETEKCYVSWLEGSSLFNESEEPQLISVHCKEV